MIRPGRDPSRHESLRSSGRALGRAAPWVRFGLVSAGATMALDQVQSLVSDAQFTWAERRIIGVVGLSYVLGFGLLGWLAGRLLSTSAGVIELLIDQSDAAHRTADLLERHAVPTLGRIALALENLASPPPPAPPAARPVAPVEVAVGEAREAIAGGRWGLADRLVGALVRDHPGPRAAALLAELADARALAVSKLRAKLEAALSTGDGLAAVDLRDALTEHLRGDELEALDRRVARLLVASIKERVRSGSDRPGVAALAARVVDSLGDTPEGASLRPSLANLRRSAGLCPRCGRPHRGEPETCPRCRASAPNPASTPVPPSGEPDLEVSP